MKNLSQESKVSWLTFKLGTSQIQVTNATTLGNLLIFTMRNANALQRELQGFLSRTCQSHIPTLQIYSPTAVLLLVLLFYVLQLIIEIDSVYITQAAYRLSPSLHLYLLTYNKYFVQILCRSIYD